MRQYRFIQLCQHIFIIIVKLHVVQAININYICLTGGAIMSMFCGANYLVGIGGFKMSSKIASKIIEIAKSKGIKLAKLETSINMSRGYINRVRRGVISEFKISHIVQIANILDVPINELLGEVVSLVKSETSILKYNEKLYDMVESYIKKELDDRSATFFSSALYNAKGEIYKYCLEEKKGKFDEAFARFICYKVCDIR